MHDLDRTQLEISSPEMNAFEFESESESADAFEFDLAAETGLEEAEEMELAADLLEISDESELDQFLGKVFKKAWKGIKKVGSAVGRVVKPLGGMLKGIAKKALPFVGGALGSMIPIPGVGTAVGSALGSAASNLLEAELEGLNDEDREFEMARRFVRLASTAARNAIQTAPGTDPRAAAMAAIRTAIRQQRAQLRAGMAGQDGEAGYEELEQSVSSTQPRQTAGMRERSGRWVRRGSKIILLGV